MYTYPLDTSVTFRFTQFVNCFRHTLLFFDQLEHESVTFFYQPLTSKVLQNWWFPSSHFYLMDESKNHGSMAIGDLSRDFCYRRNLSSELLVFNEYFMPHVGENHLCVPPSDLLYGDCLSRYRGEGSEPQKSSFFLLMKCKTNLVDLQSILCLKDSLKRIHFYCEAFI